MEKSTTPIYRACDTLLVYIAFFQNGARKHKRRIERIIPRNKDLFGWKWLFDRTRQTKRTESCDYIKFQKSLVIFDSWFLFRNLVRESRTVNSNLEFTYENHLWSSKFIFFLLFPTVILNSMSPGQSRVPGQSRAPGQYTGSLTLPGSPRAVPGSPGQ